MRKKVFLFGGIAVLVIMILLLFSPPLSFPSNTVLRIPPGTSVRAVGVMLEEKNIVRSAGLFSLFSSVFLRGEVRAGVYRFENPLGVIGVALRIERGESGFQIKKVLFPEGITVHEMARICARELLLCQEKDFIEIALKDEGYLFPDTYFFSESASAEDVIALLLQTFMEKTRVLEEDLQKTKRTNQEIIIMASLLEEEGKTENDWKKISGILWKRFQSGMPLQVDASLGYITNKGSLELTQADLATSSPYNTYRFKGLPPTPIGNPGILAMRAALYPEKTPYFFYLSDTDDVIHYSRTYEEHLALKQRYIQRRN